MPLTENESKTRAAWRTLPKSYWPLCPFVISRRFIKPAKGGQGKSRARSRRSEWKWEWKWRRKCASSGHGHDHGWPADLSSNKVKILRFLDNQIGWVGGMGWNGMGWWAISRGRALHKFLEKTHPLECKFLASASLWKLLKAEKSRKHGN